MHKEGIRTFQPPGSGELICLVFAAFILLLMTTYPYSPFLFEFFIVNHNAAYIAYVFIAIILVMPRSIILLRIPTSGSMNTYLMMSAILLAASYLHTSNLTAIRDFAMCMLLFFALYLLTVRRYLYLYRAYVRILAVLLLVSWLVVLIQLAGIVSRADWAVSDMSLRSANPLVTRALRGDFEWSLTFYYLVWPHDVNLSWQRITLIFLEPSDVASAVMAPLFVTLMDRRMPYRLLMLVTMVVSMLLSTSTWALLSIAVGLLLSGVAIAFFKSANTVFFCLIGSLVGIGIVGIVPILEVILPLLPNDKLSELYTMLDRGGFLGSLNSGNIIGMSNSGGLIEMRSYGSEVIGHRYGILGFSFYIIAVLVLVWLSLKILMTRSRTLNWRIFGFLSVFTSTLMSLKSPSFVLATPLLAYYFTVYSSQDNLRRETKIYKRTE